ncbi:MAG TPA: cytochrome c [Rhodoblastus sp.]|nr:cytochrome c [Rhodoblastus sp.]
MKFVVKTLLVSAVAAVAISGAYAQSAAIAKRKDILKGFGDATKPVAAMLKGEAAYDGAAVQKALAAYTAGAKDLKGLFPDDSKTGGDTAALPKIWEDKAKFEGIYDKLAADATAASGAIKDEASLKANFGKVLGNCKACHDDYRAKKS